MPACFQHTSMNIPLDLYCPRHTFFVTAMLLGDERMWRGESRGPWRAWTMKITEGRKMESHGYRDAIPKLAMALVDD